MCVSLCVSVRVCVCVWIKEMYRSSHPEVFLIKGILKICSKFTGERPCRNVISIKLLCNIIEITLRYGYSPGNLLHIFKTPFPRNTSRWLLLDVENGTREIIAENKLWCINVALLIVDQINLGNFSLSIKKKVYVKFGSNS